MVNTLPYNQTESGSTDQLQR